MGHWTPTGIEPTDYDDDDDDDSRNVLYARWRHHPIACDQVNMHYISFSMFWIETMNRWLKR